MHNKLQSGRVTHAKYKCSVSTLSRWKHCPKSAQYLTKPKLEEFHIWVWLSSRCGHSNAGCKWKLGNFLKTRFDSCGVICIQACRLNLSLIFYLNCLVAFSFSFVSKIDEFLSEWMIRGFVQSRICGRTWSRIEMWMFLLCSFCLKQFWNHYLLAVCPIATFQSKFRGQVLTSVICTYRRDTNLLFSKYRVIHRFKTFSFPAFLSWITLFPSFLS